MTIKVVNGKRYDTKTAENIAGAGNNLSCSDFRHYYELLYKTKKGAFFLEGGGGPLSRYSQPCGDGTSGGEDLIPLTRQEALEWCEKNNETDAIAEHFDDMIEDA